MAFTGLAGLIWRTMPREPGAGIGWGRGAYGITGFRDGGDNAILKKEGDAKVRLVRGALAFVLFSLAFFLPL